jgi:hypothetical protein
MGTERKQKKAEPVPEVTKERDAASEFLQPVIDGTQQFGSRIRLAELLSEEAGRPVSRHLVVRWLHNDPEKRQQPHLGIGLLLRKVFDKNKRQFNQPWDAASRRKPRTAKKKKR